MARVLLLPTAIAHARVGAAAGVRAVALVHGPAVVGLVVLCVHVRLPFYRPNDRDRARGCGWGKRGTCIAFRAATLSGLQMALGMALARAASPTPRPRRATFAKPSRAWR